MIFQISPSKASSPLADPCVGLIDKKQHIPESRIVILLKNVNINALHCNDEDYRSEPRISRSCEISVDFDLILWGVRNSNGVSN